MHKPMLTSALLLFATVGFAQQQATQSDPYQGQSKPPADDVIVTVPQEQPQAPKLKPRAGTPAQPEQAAPEPKTADTASQPAVVPASGVPDRAGDSASFAAHPSSVDPSVNFPNADVTGTDDGIVGVAKEEPQDAAGEQPMLRSRAADPDGDIVHPHPLQPGELRDGTTIRVHLLTRLSTEDSQPGEVFRTRVASDVMQDGQVLIPAGAEIDGRVVQVASGALGSHGTMLLRPESVTLLDGTKFRLDAQVTGAPGTGARVNGEGELSPGSRFKKDTVQYGAGVGAGAATGAIVGGPVGAAVGGIIGAGAITVHVLSSHSDATFEPGTVLLFTLDSRLDLRAAANSNGD